MHIAVDMTRCKSYAQCCFLAPDVFRFEGEEALVHDPEPDAHQRLKVLEAAAACPVQAISLDHRDLPASAGGTPARTPARTPGQESAEPRESALGPEDRVVVVGASLAGLRTAEALHRNGFTGSLTVVGAEPHEPYDRPPLSKQVLTGLASPDGTTLPRTRDVDAQWRLGVAATDLDLDAREVVLAGGERIGWDRLVIATGSTARPWPDATEAALSGVHTLRTVEDAAALRSDLHRRPRRVLVIGGGFTGSEVASVCRGLDLPVTLVDRGPAPLSGGLGRTVGEVAAQIQREHGVDLRSATSVTALEGDDRGRLRRAHLSDGEALDVDVAVVALGAVRAVDWLHRAGLDADAGGVTVDAQGRVLDRAGRIVPGAFAVGDVSRFPHPLLDGALLSVEHWGNAVTQAEVVAENLVSGDGVEHTGVPVFWSIQFGHVLKAVGFPSAADSSVVAQGSLDARSCVVAYGARGRLVGAVALGQSKWLDHYERQIAARAPFPPDARTVDQPATPRTNQRDDRRNP